MAFRAQTGVAHLRGAGQSVPGAGTRLAARPGAASSARAGALPTSLGAAPVSRPARRGPPQPAASTTEGLGARFGRGMTVPGLENLRGLAEAAIGTETDELDIEVRDVKVSGMGGEDERESGGPDTTTCARLAVSTLTQIIPPISALPMSGRFLRLPSPHGRRRL